MHFKILPLLILPCVLIGCGIKLPVATKEDIQMAIVKCPPVKDEIRKYLQDEKKDEKLTSTLVNLMVTKCLNSPEYAEFQKQELLKVIESKTNS